MTRKHHERYSYDSLAHGETDPRGRFFFTPDRIVDFTDVRILHTGVDTVRQLYRGKAHMDLINEIQDRYATGFNEIIEFHRQRWVLGSGGKSGYRYRLQNNEAGLILLIGSRYTHLDQEGAHLKIECGPHFLKDRDPKDAQAYLDSLASEILEAPEPTGVAVHIAVDVQGWTPPKDFEQRLTTRSKRRAVHEACDRLQLEGGETVQRYGDRESFLFGLPQSVQFAMYRKDREALKRDKLDYWEGIWNRAAEDLDTPAYKPNRPVWRLEWRFHHCVVQQVQREDNARFETYADVAGVLTNFLRYGLNLFRLDYSRIYIDPFWQLLVEDVQVEGEHPTFVVKRRYKTPGRGDERNLGLAFGNMMSLYARYDYSARQVIQHLKGANLWDELCHHWRKRGMDPQTVVEKALALRRFMGKAA
ncbi:hypothetical protein H0Z60_19185 [Ectothiorhodospiraceae bacterium WFHF3C12]|nr:hypothetical protein [Ectothiorhodospiraceae bacterium WFHF3C12]